MDAKCEIDSDNYIIYGHNMKNGTMFREILQYANKSYWQEHPMIRFDMSRANMKFWQLFTTGYITQTRTVLSFTALSRLPTKQTMTTPFRIIKKKVCTIQG